MIGIALGASDSRNEHEITADRPERPKMIDVSWIRLTAQVWTPSSTRGIEYHITNCRPNHVVVADFSEQPEMIDIRRVRSTRIRIAVTAGGVKRHLIDTRYEHHILANVANRLQQVDVCWVNVCLKVHFVAPAAYIQGIFASRMTRNRAPARRHIRRHVLGNQCVLSERSNGSGE